jgi:outer membrane protein TolC
MIAEKAPFPKSLALLGRVITREVEMAQWEYWIALRDLIVQITGNYWDLIYLSKSMRIYEEQIELLQSLEATAQEKVKSAMGNYTEVFGIQTTKARAEVELVTYRKELVSAQVRLLAALNLPVATGLGKPQEPALSWVNRKAAEIQSLARQNRLELHVIRLRQQKMEDMIAMSRAELYPNWTPGMSYLENDATMEKPGFPETATARPDFNFGQKESYLREMRLERAALEKEVESLAQETVAQVQELYVALDAAWRLISLSHDKLIPLAQENLKAVQISYQAGKDTDFLEVLNGARMLLEARLDFEKSRRDYGQRLTSLEKLASRRLGGQ